MVSHGYAPCSNGSFTPSSNDNPAVCRKKNYRNFDSTPDNKSDRNLNNQNFHTYNGKTDQCPLQSNPPSDLSTHTHIMRNELSAVKTSCCQFCAAAEAVAAKKENSTLKNVLLFIIITVSFG